ncbi:MAG: hypothetical protein ACFFD8_07950 [Candidatus Thorarchaeota archaeon]
MDSDNIARVLTIIGLVWNGFILFFTSWIALIFPFLLILTVAMFFLVIVLPLVAYNDIGRGSQGSAGVLLIVSGIISVFSINLVGGILLIIAGALTSGYDPTRTRRFSYDRHKPYVPQAHRSTPYMRNVPHAISKTCVNCGVILDRSDQFCHSCGTDVSWY